MWRVPARSVPLISHTGHSLRSLSPRPSVIVAALLVFAALIDIIPFPNTIRRYTMNQKFIRLLKEKFLQGIQAKTGWGKNEVEALFTQCLADAALECLDNDN